MNQGLSQQWGVCTKEHAPEDVEIHAKMRLERLVVRIPEAQQELALMMIEKERLEKMLAAVETK